MRPSRLSSIVAGLVLFVSFTGFLSKADPVSPPLGVIDYAGNGLDAIEYLVGRAHHLNLPYPSVRVIGKACDRLQRKAVKITQQNATIRSVLEFIAQDAKVALEYKSGIATFYERGSLRGLPLTVPSSQVDPFDGK